MRNKNLEKVAKDWSLVIRASQMIPVYPLTEDLQPGDVRLVSTPIEDQIKIYKKKGFIPLDQHFVRLYPDGYQAFYTNRYGISSTSIPPKNWQEEIGWSNAPSVAFPPYNFSVSTKTGLKLAIPIQGVPVALGLMNTGNASGSVLIDDAHTYGIDNFHMEKQVRDWAITNRARLQDYEPKPDNSNGKSYHFLRVITRVYVTGRVNISIRNDNTTDSNLAAGGGLDFGSPTNAKAYAETLEAFNELAKSSAPGANLSINTMSSRSITMSEPFDRPLVIGYLGFDLPILKGGRLGNLISTRAQLENISVIGSSSKPLETVYHRAALAHMNEALKKSKNEKKAVSIKNKLNEGAKEILPEAYEFTFYEPSDSGLTSTIVKGTVIPPRQDQFKQLLDYLSNAYDTIENIQSEKLHEQEPYQETLHLAQKALQEKSQQLQGTAALIRAVDYVFFGR